MNGALNLSVTPSRMLAGMSVEDRLRLKPLLHRQEILARTYLERASCPIEQIYFIESGIVSLLEARDMREPLEVGVIGCEGMTGGATILGNLNPDRDSYVQVSGQALVLSREDLHCAIMESLTLGRYLLRYMQTQMAQLSLAVSAGIRASVQQRLARKLLMYHDRLRVDDLPLTHETMSIMLGVRRASITLAIHNLEAERWIKAQRGLVTIRDRVGLEAYCGSFYGIAEAQYAAIMEQPIGVLPSFTPGELMGRPTHLLVSPGADMIGRTQ
ncbi:MAG TPA: Crp/Fnr family transcriptional regulator [Sphingobium sp.]|uniref:Crp/Fnr family transcriptional regulator n=1 Tax=Sphingobium sp. TaxID=1912891 RepID=UPI002ED618E4